MKKRVFAILLSAALCFSVLAACGNDEPVDEPSPTPHPTPEATPAPTPAGVAEIDPNLPEPAYHLTFDEDNEGIVAIVRSEDNAPSGGNFGIVEDGRSLLFADGPVGKALYLDGTHGVRLPIGAINTNTYTISYWVNADRLSQHAPTLQIGNNIGGDPNVDGGVVTWLNLTLEDFIGHRSFPTVWSKNWTSDLEVWPWSFLHGDADVEYGKREWAMFTVVATGVEYLFEETLPRIALDLYINGEKVFSANETEWEYHSLAKDVLFDNGNFDCLFGLNYWDELYKGYVDDLYFFTDALTPGQVAYLWSLGDPTVETAEPEIEEEPVAQVVTTIDDSALYTLGDPDTEVLGWWSEWTDTYEIPDGGSLTIKFNNYGRNFNNWDNYVFALTGTEYSRDTGTPPHEADGYVEYGVIRGDAFHWGDGIPEAVYDFD